MNASSVDPALLEEPSPDLAALLVEYETPDALVAAAVTLRDAGYRKWDAYSPYPVHGLDEAMGTRRTILPWLVLGAAFTGVGAAVLMQWWMTGYDYPYEISGKAPFTLPSSMPIIFELGVLFSAFAAFFGMWALTSLPTFHNPLFGNERFRRATDDALFIAVQPNDPKFDLEETGKLLAGSGGGDVVEIRQDAKGQRLPPYLATVAVILFCVALLPPVLIWKARNTRSADARPHLWHGMEWQPKKKAQTPSDLFADGRAMRPPVEGTVAHGQVYADDRLYRGIASEALQPVFMIVQEGQDSAPSPVTEQGAEQPQPAPAAGSQPADQKPAQQPPAESKATDGTAPPAAGDADGAGGDAAAAQDVDNVNWVTRFPIDIDDAAMERGQTMFNVYCSVCHGVTGIGNGQANQAAMKLGQQTWREPTNLHKDYILTMPAGKVYNTVSNGYKMMPGYKAQISVEDRWRIVLYLRALQFSQNATADDLPPDEVEKLESRK